ncbi:MAG: FeoB-associated Cys-rich membrane protein [Bacteroides sp.]|nr:FeoB-associated Cys-rich membrane protein [Eubacterium sp.]MCM1418079.1 FeoB-associated Cys-rich membrane protein [Roseburia sp.]MCM1462223.1 FeoB-associated Cys-rich membrane protein [Bacteroides sp.]
MAELILDNLGTIVVGLILLAVVALILFGMRREKKAGKHSCGGGCAGCPGACFCHKEKE